MYNANQSVDSIYKIEDWVVIAFHADQALTNIVEVPTSIRLQVVVFIKSVSHPKIGRAHV